MLKLYQEIKMKYISNMARINYIHKLLSKAKGPDPQDELDEERILELQNELEKLESLAEDYE